MTTAYDPVYSKRWRYERDHGMCRTTPGEAARAHVHALMAAGWSQRAIADAAGVGPTTLHHLVIGRVQRVKHATANALLAVTEEKMLARPNPLGFVRRVGAVRRVQALLAIGWRHADITAAIRASGTGCRVPSALMLSQRGVWINRATHDAVVRVYNELSMSPGPSVKTRRYAAAAGFAPPLAWDDDEIDDPAAKPQDPGRSTWDLKPCGTLAAYRRHLRHGEPIDESCRKANVRREDAA